MRLFFACFLIILVSAACSPEVSQPRDTVNCQINKPCNYSDGISISLGTDVVQPETPFLIIVTFPNNQTIHQATLEGIDMYMGTIPVFFSEKSTGVWHAEVMVGACSLPVMQWRLMIDIAPNGGNAQVEIDGKRRLYYSISVSR